jgi:hypothetical protein
MFFTVNDFVSSKTGAVQNLKLLKSVLVISFNENKGMSTLPWI